MRSVSSISKSLLLLTAVMFFTACGDKPKDTVKRPRQVLPEEAFNMESLMSEPFTDSTGKLSARVKGKLAAPYMLRFENGDSSYAEFPRRLHVDFYDLKMAVESQLDAKYGKYFSTKDKVFLKDSVVVKRLTQGDTIYCKQLWWDQHTEKFTTDDSVQIYTKDKILFGTGMEADQNFRWYRIKHLTGSVLSAGNNIPK